MDPWSVPIKAKPCTMNMKGKRLFSYLGGHTLFLAIYCVDTDIFMRNQ